MKIVTNRCYGGFGLSHQAIMRYAEIKGIKIYQYQDDTLNFIHYSTIPVNNEDELNENYFNDRYIERNDPALIQTVEELGKDANGEHAQLEVTEIPDGLEWEIKEYDGMEWVSEKHRTW